MKSIVVGVAGGSGSGKTTITDAICESMPFKVARLELDSYYIAMNNLSFSDRTKFNYDVPSAFEIPLLVEHIKSLRMGEQIEKPVYDFSDYNRSGQTITVYPSEVIVVEGILALEDERLRDQLDIKIFVDAPDDVRLLRRLMRDIGERGRSLESVVTQYLATVKNAHDKYVEPSKKYADIIVPEGGKNIVATEMIVQSLLMKVSKL